jgi:CxxC motif-containing protein
MITERDKTIATILLVVLAFTLVYMVLQGELEEKPVDKETFLNSLAEAQRIFIIMDLRGVSNDVVRNNIMQCGVDFAATLPLTGFPHENLTVYVLEDDKCTGTATTKTVKTCLDESNSGVSIIVTQNVKTTTYYKNRVIVKVGEQYKLGTCSIKKVE